MFLPPSPPSRSSYCDCRDQRHRACRKLIHAGTPQGSARDTGRYTAEWTLELRGSSVCFTESTRFMTGSQVSFPISHTHPPSTSSGFLLELPIEDLLNLSALEDDSIFTSTGNVTSADDLDSQAQPPTDTTFSGGAFLNPVGADDPVVPQSNVDRVSEDISSNSETPAEDSGWLSHKCGAATQRSNPDSGSVLPEAVSLQDLIVATRTCPFMTCRKSFKTSYTLRRHFRRHYLANEKQETFDMLPPAYKVKQRRQSSYPPGYTCSVEYRSTSLKEEGLRVAPSTTEETEQSWRQWAGEWWEEDTKQLLQTDVLTPETMLTCFRDDVDALSSGSPLTRRREKIFRAHLSSGSLWNITLTAIAAPPPSSGSSTPSSDHSWTSLPSFTASSVAAPSATLLDTPRDDGFPVFPVSKSLAINPKEVVPTPDSVFDDVFIDQSLIDHGDLVDLEHRSEPLPPVEKENVTEERLMKQARTAPLGPDRTSLKGVSARGQRPFQQDEQKDSHKSLETGPMGEAPTFTPTSSEATVPQSRKRGRPRKIPLTCPLSSPDIPRVGSLTQTRPVKRGRPPKLRVALASPLPADPVSYETSEDLPPTSQSSASDIKIGTEPHESQQEICVPSGPDLICEQKPPLDNDRRPRKCKAVSYSDVDVDDLDPADDDDYNYVEEEEIPRPRKRRYDREEEYQDRPRRKGRNKRFPCTVQGCSSTFVRKSDIGRHIQRIHKNVSSLCPDCKLAFSRTDAVLRHIRVLHGKEFKPDKRDFVTIET
ncbi:hypothetical protein L218DRAFT_525327 [Marasmius fiardii PR-910]|nr:hypothetical protein L218DRAFT_525327 [Marasmius fiardii PR-910]